MHSLSSLRFLAPRLAAVILCISAISLSRSAGALDQSSIPPGSLVLRGPSVKAGPSGARSTPTNVNAPMSAEEQALGLAIAEASRKPHGYQIIKDKFDVTLFCRHVLYTLPLSAADQAKLGEQSYGDPNWCRILLNNVVDDVRDAQLHFLGLRTYLGYRELLFRDGEAGIAHFDPGYPVVNTGNPLYYGLVLQRAENGELRVVDVHRLAAGELLSQEARRELLVSLAGKGYLQAPTDPRDIALLSHPEAFNLFQQRYSYGKRELLVQAYEKLPPEMRDDRLVLDQLASTWPYTLHELSETLQRWHQTYPEDPSPQLLLLNAYWQFYYDPRGVEGTNGYIDISCHWTPAEETGAEEATERAMVWFADPAMEIRLASYFASRQPEKAKALLHRALHRFPYEPAGALVLDKINVAARAYGEVADNLREEEAQLHTNLTSMVAGSRIYDEFRKSFAWKQWQHDSHGVDSKTLMIGVAEAAK